MTRTHGRPYHSQAQGNIESWYRSMKNQIFLHDNHLLGELEGHLRCFVSYYNYERYHEPLNNLMPADVFFGRDKDILTSMCFDQTKHVSY